MSERPVAATKRVWRLMRSVFMKSTKSLMSFYHQRSNTRFFSTSTTTSGSGSTDDTLSQESADSMLVFDVNTANCVVHEDRLCDAVGAPMLESIVGSDPVACNMIASVTGTQPEEFTPIYCADFRCVYVNSTKSHSIKILHAKNSNDFAMAYRMWEHEKKIHECIENRCDAHLSLPLGYTFYSSFQNRILFTIMPYYGFDAFNIISSHDQLNLRLMTSFVGQLYGGIRILHERGLCHNDIKLENITYQDGIWKLIDFGASAIANNRYVPPVLGTVPFVLPVLGGEHRNDIQPSKMLFYAQDIFAFAMTVLEVLGIYRYYACDACRDTPTECPDQCTNSSEAWGLADIEEIYGLLRYKYTRVPFRNYGGWFQDNELSLRQIMRLVDVSSEMVTTCAEIVLSQVDVSAKYLAWDKRTRRCYYVGVNNLFSQDIEKNRQTNIGELWFKLGEIVNNL